MSYIRHFERPEFVKPRAAIEAVLQDLLRRRPETHPMLQSAMEYVCLDGGKRLRAIMLVRLTETLHGPDAAALLCAAAIEMIHAASLVLDDLPAMDNANMRRGRPACHRKFDEATAILSAFALVNLAFETIARLPITNSHVITDVVAELAHTIGPDGMITGQMEDLYSGTGPHEVEDVERIHYKKTAILFEASAAIPGYLVQAQELVQASLRRFGRAFGMAFQLTDDLADYVGEASETGKPVRQDQKKWTHILVGGIDLARQRFESHYAEAHRIAMGSEWFPAVQGLLEALYAAFQDLSQRS